MSAPPTPCAVPPPGSAAPPTHLHHHRHFSLTSPTHSHPHTLMANPLTDPPTRRTPSQSVRRRHVDTRRHEPIPTLAGGEAKRGEPLDIVIDQRATATRATTIAAFGQVYIYIFPSLSLLPASRGEKLTFSLSILIERTVTLIHSPPARCAAPHLAARSCSTKHTASANE